MEIIAELQKDLVTGTMMIIFAEKRIAFVRVKDIEILGADARATLEYSFNIAGIFGKGNFSYDGTVENKIFFGRFTKNYSPLEMEFLLTFNDQGSYDFNFKYIGDEESKFEFLQKQEIGWDTVWTQRQIADGVVLSDYGYRAVGGSYFVNIFVLTLGNFSAKSNNRENIRTVELTVEPNKFKDINFSLKLNLKNPEDKFISSFTDMYFADLTESTWDVGYLKEGEGEFGIGYSARMLRDGKLVLGDSLDVNFKNSNETSLLTLDTETEYSRDFFAYEYICDAYTFLPGGCFTREKSKLKILLDKTNKVFGLLSPFEIHHTWEHDGIKTMATSLNAIQNPFVFNLYLPYYLPQKINETNLFVTADYESEEEKLTVRTNLDEMKLVVKKDSNNYRAEFKRFGQSHLSLDVNFLNNLIHGNMQANYLQLSDSTMTRVLCSGMDCFEQVILNANYTLDMSLAKYSVDIDLISVSVEKMHIEKPDSLQLEEGEQKDDEAPASEENPSSLDDSFLLNFRRMQNSLDKIQDVGLYELSGSKLTETNQAFFTQIEPDSLKNGNYEPSSLLDQQMISGPEIINGKKMSIVVDLLERQIKSDIQAQDGTYLNSMITWENNTLEENKITFNSFENMILNTRSQFTIDWLTPENKFGFLFIRYFDLEPVDKALLNIQKGDLTILTDPGAPLSVIGQQSVYGMGILGPGVGHVVMGKMEHWDKTD